LSFCVSETFLYVFDLVSGGFLWLSEGLIEPVQLVNWVSVLFGCTRSLVIVEAGLFLIKKKSATSQQYFCLTTNQSPAISQQYFSLRTNQHQPSATSQTNRLHVFLSMHTAQKVTNFRNFFIQKFFPMLFIPTIYPI
jgi:hypothetical protein